MTWAHPPASQPAGQLSVAAASGTCSPDEPSSPAGPSAAPLTGVPAPISSDCCNTWLALRGHRYLESYGVLD